MKRMPGGWRDMARIREGLKDYTLDEVRVMVEKFLRNKRLVDGMNRDDRRERRRRSR